LLTKMFVADSGPFSAANILVKTLCRAGWWVAGSSGGADVG
jgi:hypothetical protein